MSLEIGTQVGSIVVISCIFQFLLDAERAPNRMPCVDWRIVKDAESAVALDRSSRCRGKRMGRERRLHRSRRSIGGVRPVLLHLTKRDTGGDTGSSHRAHQTSVCGTKRASGEGTRNSPVTAAQGSDASEDSAEMIHIEFTIRRRVKWELAYGDVGSRNEDACCNEVCV